MPSCLHWKLSLKCTLNLHWRIDSRNDKSIHLLPAILFKISFGIFVLHFGLKCRPVPKLPCLLTQANIILNSNLYWIWSPFSIIIVFGKSCLSSKKRQRFGCFCLLRHIKRWCFVSWLYWRRRWSSCMSSFISRSSTAHPEMPKTLSSFGKKINTYLNF